jgi:hypothetical protein
MDKEKGETGKPLLNIVYPALPIQHTKLLQLIFRDPSSPCRNLILAVNPALKIAKEVKLSRQLTLDTASSERTYTK